VNIALFSDTYLPQINGVVTSTVSFKEEFERMGHQVFVMCPKINRHDYSTEKEWRFRSVAYPFQKEYRFVLPFSRQVSAFKHLKMDIIHSQTPFSMGYLADYLSRRHKVPLIHTYHTYFTEYLHYFPLMPLSIMKKWSLWESRRYCNRCDAVIAPSQPMAEHLNRFGVTSPVSVIPTGVTPPSITEAHCEDLCKRYGFTSKDRFLLFVGRLGREKNVFFLLDAFEAILKVVPESKLLIIGDGPERRNMEKIVAKKGLKESVIFTGYLDKVRVFTALSCAELLLFPSKTETQGLSIVEGLCMGTPAVCINKMGVSEVLKNEKGGELTEDSLDDYVAKAIRLLQDKPYFEQKRLEAFEQSKVFSVKDLAKKMILVYEDVIKKRKK